MPPDVGDAPSAGALVDALVERYGFERLALRERLSGGYANDLLLAEAPGRRVVVRVKHPPVRLDEVQWEHRLVSLLAPRLREVPAPLRARDGSSFFVLDGAAVWVLPHVDGRPADPSDERHRLEAAALLGRFHAATADLDLPPRPGLTRLADLRPALQSGRYFEAIGSERRALPAPLPERQEEIEAGHAWALAFVEAVAAGRTPRAGVIHADLFAGNVLVRAGRAIALIDWDEANVDWLAFDLACAAWEFCADADGALDGQAFAAFLRAYRDAGGTVPAYEDDLLVGLMRVRRVLELLRAPYDRHVDVDHQLRNLCALQRLA
jgi:homoserine kinase type II